MGIMGALMDLILITRDINENGKYKASISADGECAKILVKEPRPQEEFCRTTLYANISFGSANWEKEVTHLKNDLLALLNNA